MNSEKEDAILDEAILRYSWRLYSEQVTKEKKRTIRKSTLNLVVEAGEVFMKKKKERKVCMYTLIYISIYKIACMCIYICTERDSSC